MILERSLDDRESVGRADPGPGDMPLQGGDDSTGAPAATALPRVASPRAEVAGHGHRDAHDHHHHHHHGAGDHGHRHHDGHGHHGRTPLPAVRRDQARSIRIRPSLMRFGAGQRLSLSALVVLAIWVSTLSVIG